MITIFICIGLPVAMLLGLYVWTIIEDHKERKEGKYRGYRKMDD